MNACIFTEFIHKLLFILHAYQKKGADAIEINEKRGITNSKVRCKIYDLLEGDMISTRVERVIDNINSSRPLLQKASSNGLWPNGTNLLLRYSYIDYSL